MRTALSLVLALAAATPALAQQATPTTDRPAAPAAPTTAPVVAPQASGAAAGVGTAAVPGSGVAGTGGTARGAAPTTLQPALPGAARVRLAEKPGEVAKRAPINGVLVLYGNERCPTNDNGEEIVICERRSAQEQFRVPKELRDFQVTPQNQSWAARAKGVLDTGVGTSSIGSCSPVGPGGQSGCFAQRAREAREERKQQKAEEARIP